MERDIIIVKIGSNSLVNTENWEIRRDIMKWLASDISSRMKFFKEKFIIITSWAVATWKSIIKSMYWEESLLSSAEYASIWQARLMNIYEKIFRKNWLIIWQWLIDDPYNINYIFDILSWSNSINIPTEDDLRARTELLKECRDNHIRTTLLWLLNNWIIPIINHNDFVSPVELKQLTNHADNDNNALFFAWLIRERVKTVILLTNTQWVLDSNWRTVSWWFLWEVDKDKIESIHNKLMSHISSETSSAWTWWMASKVNTLIKVTELWINGHIASAQTWLQTLSEEWISTKIIFTN